MPFLDRGKVKLYYEVHGKGIPLLLSHGYSSTSAMWQGQIDAFTRAGFKLIVWDMRGHGQTSYPQDQSEYSEAHTVEDIAAILNHVCGHNQSAIVGGLSLGGYMSLAFYLVYPTRAKSLLIIDTGPGYKSDQAREGWNKYALATAARLEEDGPERLWQESPERSRVQHRNANGLIRAARGMLTQHNAAVIKSLPYIKVPTLLVVGADDEPFLAATDYMEKKIPGSRKFVVPDAGHAVNMDQPARFNEGVLKFLVEAGFDGNVPKI